MAPLAENNTPRFRLHYDTVAQSHVMQFRSHESPGSIAVIMDALWTAMGVDIFATTFVSLEFAASGSNIFNPVAAGIIGNTYGAGAGATLDVPVALNFIGRSTGGRRVRMAMFGFKNYALNYRVTPGENAQVDAAIAVLVAAGSKIVAIDDITPVWKAYANVKAFDHWVAQVR